MAPPRSSGELIGDRVGVGCGVQAPPSNVISVLRVVAPVQCLGLGGQEADGTGVA